MCFHLFVELPDFDSCQVKFVPGFPQVRVADWVVAPVMLHHILSLKHSTSERQRLAHTLQPYNNDEYSAKKGEVLEQFVLQ